MKIRKHIILADDFDVDAVEDLYDEFNEVDYFYGDCFIRFYGTPERLQEVLRACKNKAIRIKDS